MFLCVTAYTYIYTYSEEGRERVIALKKTTYLNNIFDSSLPIIFIIYINIYHLHMYLYMYVWIYMYLSLSIYVYIYIYIYIYIQIYIQMSKWVCIWRYKRKKIQIRITLSRTFNWKIHMQIWHVTPHGNSIKMHLFKRCSWIHACS